MADMVHPRVAEAAAGKPASDTQAASTAGQDRLLLKWGTLKGWDLKSEAARAAMQRYFDAPGDYQLSAMQQRDTPEQKQALCELIEAIDGVIVNDWSGETLTQDAAKQYVLTYGAADDR